MASLQQAQNQVNRNLEQRRTHASRVESTLAREHIVKGKFLLQGAGEGLVELKFPVWFIEEPNMGGLGGVMYPGSEVIDGSYPTVSGSVLNWTLVEKTPRQYFTGCTLAVVTTGLPEQRMFVHYRFEGKAIVNPVNPVETADTVV